MDITYRYRENKTAYMRLAQLQSGGGTMFKFEVDEYATAWQMFWNYFKKLPNELRDRYKMSNSSNVIKLLAMSSRQRILFGKEYYNSNTIKDVIDEVMITKEYKEFLKTVTDYKNNIEREWEEKKDLILSEIRDIMKVGLPPLETHNVTIIPKAGFNLRNNHIYWGALNNEEFPNYGIIYLMHEYLHSVFGLGDVEHVVIELIADNELRKRLNLDSDYRLDDKESVGHDFLDGLRNTMIKDWNEYLTTDRYSDIFDFVSHMKEEYGENISKGN
jgi:hypothetical protein